MHDFTNALLGQVILHKVGNKQLEESLLVSKSVMKVEDDTTHSLLLSYFLTPFKKVAYFNFSNKEENEVYASAASIFDDPKSFYINSVNLAKHLFIQGEDSRIKGGELFVVHLKNCTIDGEVTEAVGLFKSENKETYLKITHDGDSCEVTPDEGINITKLEKGCVIFNVEKEQGFRVSIIDNKSGDGYWQERFLKLKPREDSFHQTQNYLQMCKGFVTDVLQENKEIGKPEQIEVLNKSVKYFKENETFNEREFESNVMQQPEIIEAFQDYKSHFKNTKDVPIADEFDISTNAVKDSTKIFKTVLKLDKNFSVYIHGNKDYISQGHDEGSGLSYYTLFYKQEK